jgi:hypothetical protein
MKMWPCASACAPAPFNDGSYNRVLRARLASVHTQFSRASSIAKSLARRFGRAAGRALPFIGGIAILASGPEFAENFIAAANDYARDIREGEDETGSAAILAGYCNDLAPGSGNLVLSCLLR